IDVLTEVRSGDTVLVPHGWHGPCAAAPGHDMYYLNVMAGPEAERAWNITDHPDQTWVRGTWDDAGSDPRLEGESRRPQSRTSGRTPCPRPRPRSPARRPRPRRTSAAG